MTRTFIQDVIEQPKVLEHIASFYSSKSGKMLLDLISQLRTDVHRDIIFTGMGSSYSVSRFAATYLWSVGKKAWYMEASELLHYGSGALLENALVVLTSQSGESVEIKQVLEHVPKSTTIVGITGNMESTLAKKSAIVLPILSGEESTTSSKTYTSSIAVAFILAQVMAGLDTSDIMKCIEKAAQDLDKLIREDSNHIGKQVSEKLLKAKSIHFIGRGPGVSTAFQGALMFKELVKIQVECMEAAQFRHGPLETVGPGTVVVIFAPVGRTGSLLLSFADELKSYGAAVFVIRDGVMYEDFSSLIGQETRKPEVYHEFAAALIDIFPIQILGNLMAEQLGTTGAFKWITKVTSKQ